MGRIPISEHLAQERQGFVSLDEWCRRTQTGKEFQVSAFLQGLS